MRGGREVREQNVRFTIRKFGAVGSCIDADAFALGQDLLRVLVSPALRIRPDIDSRTFGTGNT